MTFQAFIKIMKLRTQVVEIIIKSLSTFSCKYIFPFVTNIHEIENKTAE